MGYGWFFIWVCLCTIPGIILAGFLPIPKDFGKKKKEKKKKKKKKKKNK
jgi:hypothetical protein